jgi:integrase
MNGETMPPAPAPSNWKRPPGQLADFAYAPESVRGRDGVPVDVRGDVWELKDPRKAHVLDWRTVRIATPAILEAAKDFIRLRIGERAPDTVAGEFRAIFIASRTTFFRRDDLAVSNGTRMYLGSEILNEMVEGGIGRVSMTRWRYFYRWACRMNDRIRGPRHGFDREVALFMSTVELGPLSKEMEAVLNLMPRKGPLLDVELQEVVDALADPLRSSAVNLQERVAIWTNLALGSNRAPMALLRHTDLVKLRSREGVETYFLRVPRQKKQDDEYVRKSFKPRRVNEKIGRLIRLLRVENRRHPSYKLLRTKGWAAPLFFRPEPNMRLSETQHKEYTMHYEAEEFSKLVRRAVDKLGIVSPRTGQGLVVTPRRLRHTFATNLALLDVPAFAIAESLDHSSLNTVMVYVDNVRVLQEQIDDALDEMMSELKAGFCGRVVEDEKAAGGNAATRLYADIDQGGITPIGNCGYAGECDRAPPLACYTCRWFRPWLSANHAGVLSLIVGKAKTLEAQGSVGRLVGLHAKTNRAIRNLLVEIETLKADQNPRAT